MEQYLFHKFKTNYVLIVSFMVKESAHQCDKNLMLIQILQNIIFLVEALLSYV